MFVLTQTAKVIDGNTDPAIAIILFATIAATIILVCAILIHAAIQKRKQNRRKR